MDLSSHLESQSFDKIEEDSRLNDEAHDLPALPKAKKKVNGCGVGVSICNGCTFAISFCTAIITTVIVSVENTKVIGYLSDHSTEYNISSGCILSGKFDRDASPNSALVFSDTATCHFVMFGTAALSGMSLLYMYGSCCRVVFSCVCGFTA